MPRQTLGYFVIRAASLVNLQAHPSQPIVKGIFLWYDFRYMVYALKCGFGIASLYQSTENGLACRSKQYGYAKHPLIRLQSIYYWLKKIRWQRLHFVKNDDAIGNIVQLSTLRWFIAEHRLKQLHVRCHDDRIVPILSGKLSLVLHIIAFERLRIEIAMMFQNGFFSEYLFEYGSCLHYNTCIRNGDDYPFHAIA